MRLITEQRGSIAPLGIGFFILSMSMMLIVINSASLFIFQKRLTNIAEADVLFIAGDGGTSADYLIALETGSFESFRIGDKILSDGKTVEVEACARWNPIFAIRGPAAFDVCSHASARSEGLPNAVLG
jgi:hypothetical protein